MDRVLVSACLRGDLCRWDGTIKARPEVLEALDGHDLVFVCPEVAGGLGVPRPACDLSGGDGGAVWRSEARVVDQNGRDRTDEFRRGAWACLAAAPDAAFAVLKARSPSCGTDAVHVDGALVPGRGVFAALLVANGIPVQSDEARRPARRPATAAS